MEVARDVLDRISALSPQQQEEFLRRLPSSRAPGAVQTPIPKRTSARPPLSFNQQRLWFLDQLDPGSPHYNMPMRARIRGPLAVDILERSLNLVVARHEALRTTFELAEGAPVQVVRESLWVPLPVTELSHLAPEQAEAAAERFMVDRSREPFDLSTGPLVRADVIRLAPDCHVLAATLHHIIADAWSIGIILRELTVIYEALRHGQEPPLGDPPVQFPDYAQWQRDWLRGDALESQVEYWRGQLDGELTMATLPTDRPRPAEQSFRGAHHYLRLPEGLSRRLDALATAAGATPFSLFVAALSTLVHRYGGQDRIGIGAPIAGRTRVDLEGMVAFLSNTVLLCTDMSGTPTFRQVLARSHETTVGAQANQDVPFDKIVELVRPERSLSATPLIQVVLVFKSAAEAGRDTHAWGLASQTEAVRLIDNRTSKFDLTFGVEPEGDEYTVAIEYSTDLFDAETIARMGGHLVSLLTAAAADPDRPVGDLPMLPDDERRRLLVDWNATGAAFPDDACLHGLIAARAAAQPDAVAAVCGEDKLTYRELLSRANRLAHHLIGLGAGPDIPVAVSMPRSLDLVVALVGILIAGSPYLPVDPGYPPERIAYILANGQARILVSTDATAARLGVDGRVRVVRVDRDAERIAGQPATSPAVPVRPDHLAYVIYTSGSTGQPKGVELDHRGRVNNFHDFNSRFAVGPGDTLLAVAAVGFDMSAYDILGSLMAGATVVVVDSGADRDAARWLELMRRNRVTVWHSVPALLEMLVEYALLEPDVRVPDLRLVLLGGDWIPLSLPDRLRRLAAGARVVALGGATEASMDSTLYEVDRVDPRWRSVPYGRPMANQRCYVLDARLQPVPVNTPGDLYLAGVGLGRGYRGDPGLTATKFVANPLPEEPGPRLYRTGDLARYRSDGTLELLGRSDHQIKIRGWRIEPGEVEAALRDQTDVRDALVTAWTDESGGRHLVAYLVAAGDRGPDGAALAERLRDCLPAHLVPRYFVPVDALPLTPNGKVDRGRLPAPRPADAPDPGEYVAPRSRVESVLAEVWQELLGVPRVGVTDNFFALGGDSIKSIQAIARLRTRGLVLTPKQMFQRQTIAELARVAQDSAPSADGTEDCSAEVSAAELDRLRQRYPDVVAAYPLSPMQRRMLRIATSLDTSGLYVIQADYLFVPGGVNVDLLRQAWQFVLDHHPTLRTSFAWEGLDEPLQLVHSPVELTVHTHDLRGLDVAEQERRQHELVQADRRRGFDLTRAPLLRLHMIQVGEDTYKYLFTNHHIILDGWSRAIVQQQAFAVYEALLRGEEPRLPPARPFASYLGWLRRRDLAAAERFWRHYLDGFAGPTPLVRARGLPQPSRRGPFGKQNLPLDPQTFADLRAFCRGTALTINTVMQGAWLLLMSRYTGERDIVLGVTSSGRATDFPGVDTITGLCMNTLPVRVSVPPARPVREWLADLQTTQVDLRQYEYTPLDSIIGWTGRAPNDQLFECMMVFENYPWDGTLRQLEGRMEAEHPLLRRDYQLAQFEFPLRVEVAPGGNHLLIVHYYQDSFADDTITAMLADWLNMIKAVVASPDAPLATHL